MDSRITDSIKYRLAVKEDASIIAELLTELGHPNTGEDVGERWHEWSAFPGNEVLIAILHDQIVGLAILGQSPSLYRSFPLGRLWALVVTEKYRSLGIGREFLSVIEDRFSNAGCGMIELTSNVIRSDAHRFYLQLGYEKSSFRFAKKIRAAGE